MGKDEAKSERNARRIIREERLAFARFKDIIRKYRLIIPSITERAEKLEEKVRKLSDNSEESEKKLGALKDKIENAQKKVKSSDKKLVENQIKRKELTDRYNTLLEGKSPLKIEINGADKGMDGLKKDKEKLIAEITRTFDSIEKKLTKLEKEKSALEKKKSKLNGRIEQFYGKSKIIKRKIAYYQSDISEALVELNDQTGNEQKLMDEYNQLIYLMKEAPDLSTWSLKLVKETIASKFPGQKVLDLQNPISHISLPLQ